MRCCRQTTQSLSLPVRKKNATGCQCCVEYSPLLYRDNENRKAAEVPDIEQVEETTKLKKKEIMGLGKVTQ